ncbi:MAG: hypothetical protein WBZ27_20510, partial [Pseudolabrys sp.]
PSSPPYYACFADAFARDSRHRVHLQSSSASRFTAGASGFLNLSQSGERPDLYRDPRRFETIPSRPKLPVGIGAVSYHTRAVGPFP